MFIIHGSLNTEKAVGMVADNCAVCGALALLRMTQIRRKEHLYFIPLGSGQLVGTVLKCNDCGGAVACEPGRFAECLPEKLARTLHVGEVVQRTNPKLAEAIAYRARLEQEATSSGRLGLGGIDPRVELAFEKIAHLDRRDPRVNALQATLAQWSALDVAAQSRLLRDVDVLVDGERCQQSCERFVNLVGQRFKPDIDGGVKFLTFVMVLAIGVAATAKYLIGIQGGLVIGFVASFVAAVLLAMLVDRQLRRWRHKRFFRKVFLTELEKRNLALAPVMERLCSINTSDETTDIRLRGMAKALPLLREVLAEENRYLEEPQLATDSHTSLSRA